MEYENKYKEEIIRATQLWECGDITRENLEYIFPELKESEDEKIKGAAIEFVRQNKSFNYRLGISKEEVIAWLEKQGEQKPTKWSEEDEEMLDAIIVDIQFTQKAHTHDVNQVVYEIEIDWLKSLKERVGCEDSKKQGEQKVEEIDEEYKIGKWFTGLIPCWINAPSTLQPEHSNHGKNVVAVHLKGGGYRCCCVDDKKPITFSVAENTPFVEGWHNRESSAWKPSDGQMSALSKAIAFVFDSNSDVKHSLESLYNELKKLF